MLANAGGSVADIQGAIELLRSAPDRCQILRSSNRSMRQDFKSVVRGQASQQVAIKRTAPHARWRRDATARLFMVLGSLAGEQGMIDLLRVTRLAALPTLARAAASNLAVINTSSDFTGGIVMDEFCSITDDDELVYRERATALLDELAQQARGILRNAGIGIDVIFVVPPSGDVLLTFGTAAELYSEDWKAIKATVSSLVRRSIGLDPAQCRQVVCAMVHAGDAAS